LEAPVECSACALELPAERSGEVGRSDDSGEALERDFDDVVVGAGVGGFVSGTCEELACHDTDALGREGASFEAERVRATADLVSSQRLKRLAPDPVPMLLTGRYAPGDVNPSSRPPSPCRSSA